MQQKLERRKSSLKPVSEKTEKPIIEETVNEVAEENFENNNNTKIEDKKCQSLNCLWLNNWLHKIFLCVKWINLSEFLNNQKKLFKIKIETKAYTIYNKCNNVIKITKLSEYPRPEKSIEIFGISRYPYFQCPESKNFRNFGLEIFRQFFESCGKWESPIPNTRDHPETSFFKSLQHLVKLSPDIFNFYFPSTVWWKNFYNYSKRFLSEWGCFQIRCCKRGKQEQPKSEAYGWFFIDNTNILNEW